MMKSLFASKRIAGMLVAILFLSAFGVMPKASAADITKTFELGLGTAQARSHFRTFNVPSGLPVTAAVEYYRLGDAGAQNDVPLVIELREPGADASTEGAIVATRNVTATRTRQTVSLSSPGRSRGCDNPWRVRVRAAGADPQVAVKGSITMSFDLSVRTLTISPFNINLPKGNRVIKDLSGITGSGTVRIKAEWHTSPLELLHLGKFYSLTFRLKRNGTTVRTASGLSQHASQGTKMELVHFISPEQAAGATWTLEIESFAPADIVDLHINESGAFRSTFTPGCN